MCLPDEVLLEFEKSSTIDRRADIKCWTSSEFSLKYVRYETFKFDFPRLKYWLQEIEYRNVLLKRLKTHILINWAIFGQHYLDVVDSSFHSILCHESYCATSKSSACHPWPIHSFGLYGGVYQTVQFRAGNFVIVSVVYNILNIRPIIE